MKELLKEMLTEYITRLDKNKNDCYALMKEGKEWKEKAKEGAGLKLMIEATVIEIAKYEK